MRTVDAIQTAIYRLVKAATLVPVGKMVKPSGSVSEYIVINTLPIGAGIIQSGVANINIHVKDIVVDANGYPNSKRIDEIATPLISLFDNATSGNYSFKIETMHIEEEEGLKEHYMNLRVKFNVINN